MECPICEVPFESEDSVIGHITGSTDEAHKGVGYQQARELLDNSSAQDYSSASNYSSKSSAESSGSVLYESREQAESNTGQSSEQSSNQCCSSPTLTGSAGEMYRLSSGDVVQLDDGDQICTNCDEVIEA
jgi:hypothetical protein